MIKTHKNEKIKNAKFLSRFLPYFCAIVMIEKRGDFLYNYEKCIFIMRKIFLGGIVMEQLKRKLWLKRSAVAGLALATCASFTVGAFLWTPESKTALAAGGTVVSEFTEADTTVTGAPAWQNGKHNNWVVPEGLGETLYYALYNENNEYVDTKAGVSMEFAADPDDASDSVLKYWTGASGVYLTQFTFANEVKTSEIASLTLRLYAHVDTDNASKIQIFPSEVQNTDSVDAYSYSYYEYPLTVQNEWVELTLTGNDLAKITDGTFEGFVVKIQMSANAYPRNARGGSAADKHSGYILFDSVVTEKKAPKTKLVDFTTADTTVTSAPAWENGKNNNWVNLLRRSEQDHVHLRGKQRSENDCQRRRNEVYVLRA